VTGLVLDPVELFAYEYRRTWNAAGIRDDDPMIGSTLKELL